ncbi:UDP-glucose 4-epimerase family protein [Legionella fairfieldensis]|uniref:UDP-glucose 4-epimerase family protein n=1 Tax=Legionella fairfieldensis TaxID=45064 RepID=UPI000490BA6C|nr:SDR family oxidoreductase [Legionella fairfieldensis]
MSEQTKKTILLTGATGFLGRQLTAYFLQQGNSFLRLVSRSKIEEKPDPKITVLLSRPLSAESNWYDALHGCDVVIHTAARVHIMKDKADDPLHEFRKVNVEGTLNLARQAAHLGVKRFIFISSIKVNGESTARNQTFLADDLPQPLDAYGQSKYEAEQGLQHLAEETGMEVVIIRPPLIYGPGVKGNFQRLMRCLQKGIPLPFGAITNKRSFVSINNLMSLIAICIEHPKAANQIFLVSDGEDLSTTDLLRKIGQAMNKPARLLIIPQNILHLLANLSGKKAIFQRVCGSLRVDISKTCEKLGWTPEMPVSEALNLMVKNYLLNQPQQEK